MTVSRGFLTDKYDAGISAVNTQNDVLLDPVTVDKWSVTKPEVV
jgi:hypothetical protein